MSKDHRGRAREGPGLACQPYNEEGMGRLNGVENSVARWLHTGSGGAVLALRMRGLQD